MAGSHTGICSKTILVIVEKGKITGITNFKVWGTLTDEHESRVEEG